MDSDNPDNKKSGRGALVVGSSGIGKTLRDYYWSLMEMPGDRSVRIIDPPYAVDRFSWLLSDLRPVSYGFSDRYRRLPSTSASASMVARTVWTLWENDLSIIWDLLRRWTDDSDVLLETCEEIVELGFEKYRFSAEEVFHTVESWLTTDAPGNQRAAANLLQLILPAITKESLSKLTSQWTAADLEKSLFGFSRAMRQIFYKEPSWTLKTFQQWARSQKEIYDQLIADTLELVSPPDGPPEFYAAFEKQLIALRMASRNTRISTETQRLVKLTRDLRSRSGHDPAHQRIDPRLPRAKRKRGKSFR